MRNLSRLATLTVALAAHPAAHPVTPVTPSLTAPTRADLVQQLSAAQFSEAAQSGVFAALTGVLGMEPAARSFAYDQPYPQLPKAQAEAVRLSDQCARVRLTAWMAATGNKPKVQLDGTYCLQGMARWHATSQVIEVAPDQGLRGHGE